MKHIINEGTFKRSKTIFIVTGLFLITLFGYQLYNHLQTDQFVAKFPGDWDKVLGIAIGLFLIIRSRKFNIRARDIFIEIGKDQLTYRVSRSSSVDKIPLSDIDHIRENGDKIILTTKNASKLTIADFGQHLIRDDKRKTIKKSLLELNDSTLKNG